MTGPMQIFEGVSPVDALRGENPEVHEGARIIEQALWAIRRVAEAMDFLADSGLPYLSEAAVRILLASVADLTDAAAAELAKASGHPPGTAEFAAESQRILERWRPKS